jgi:hypothetical protein
MQLQREYLKKYLPINVPVSNLNYGKLMHGMGKYLQPQLMELKLLNRYSDGVILDLMIFVVMMIILSMRKK